MVLQEIKIMARQYNKHSEHESLATIMKELQSDFDLLMKSLPKDNNFIIL